MGRNVPDIGAPLLPLEYKQVKKDFKQKLVIGGKYLDLKDITVWE